MQLKLTHADVQALAHRTAESIRQYQQGSSNPNAALRAYAVPRGGVPAAYLLQGLVGFHITSDPADADIFIDDLIDSGSTCERYCDEYPGKPFFALIDKREGDVAHVGQWVVFPWEVTDEGADDSGTDVITRLLQLIGEDANREGLSETPARVVKAWKHWCSGYGKDAGKLLKVFEDGAEKYDQMVIVKDIPIYSHCEHHLAAIIGTASIAYIPNGKIVGLSKLSRLADMFARRLQVQERLTDQIADALVEHLQPIGVGVIIKARHLCMESRGVCQQGHHTITTALRGAIKDEAQTRSEFLRLAN
jgi:GTP cyclohydrolase I